MRIACRASLTLLAAIGLTGIDHSAAAAQADEPFVLEEKVELCTSCHGEAGLPIEPDIPIISGQEFYYLYVQLKDYEAGRRSNEVMSEMVKGLSRDDMKALATYFSEQPWPETGELADPALEAEGRKGLSAGQCSQCHSTYAGDSRIPRLAGQQRAYLEKTMLDFKNKVRRNAPDKSSLLASFPDEDLQAMSHSLVDP